MSGRPLSRVTVAIVRAPPGEGTIAPMHTRDFSRERGANPFAPGGAKEGGSSSGGFGRWPIWVMDWVARWWNLVGSGGRDGLGGVGRGSGL